MEYETTIIELAMIRGHLEGYADMLRLTDVDQDKLHDALLADAAELNRIASSLRERIPLVA